MAGELEIIMIASIVMLPIAGFIYYKKVIAGYKTSVVIWNKRGNGVVPSVDKGKAIRQKNGEIFYRLKTAKQNIEPAQFGSIYVTEGGKTILNLYSPQRGVYKPCTVDTSTEEANIKVLDADVDFWRSNEINKALTMWLKKGLLEQYGWVAAICIVMICMGITLYMVYDGVSKVAAANAGIAQTNEKVLERLENILGKGSTSTVTTNPNNNPGNIPSGVPPF